MGNGLRLQMRVFAGTLILTGALIGMPSTGGADSGVPTSGTGCAEPYRPYAHDHTDSSTIPSVPLAGEPVPYTTAGAEAQLVERNSDRIVFTISLGGESRTFTTEPFPAGVHYPNRSPGPEEAPFGRLSIVQGPDGGTYVLLESVGSGSADAYGWRFDDPCGSTPAGAVGTRPTYTG